MFHLTILAATFRWAFLAAVRCISAEFVSRPEPKAKRLLKMIWTNFEDDYAIALDIIETSKGIVRYCVLNDMKYFHILDNYNADIMHDLAEGVMPFLVRNIFKHCTKNISFTDDELKNCALTHDYGIFNSNNIPSPTCNERRNFGQNASQKKCLLHNIPYTLYQHKDHPKLVDVWPCVTSIFKIVRIVYSAKINNNNLLELESSVSVHM